MSESVSPIHKVYPSSESKVDSVEALNLRLDKQEYIPPFHFCLGINDYTGISAASYEELLKSIKKVQVKSLSFHVDRGDFEKWVTDVFHDEHLTKQIRELRERKLRGQALRNRFYRIVSERLEELSAEAL